MQKRGDISTLRSAERFRTVQKRLRNNSVTFLNESIMSSRWLPSQSGKGFAIAFRPSQDKMADAAKPQDASRLKSHGPRIDACWHVPVIAALALCFTSNGVANSGFFFVELMKELKTNRAQASWPRNAMAVMMNMAGAIFWLLQRWLSAFHIALIGSVLACIGMISSAFSPSMPFVTVTYGVIYGTGFGMTTFSLSIIIMMYFDKYRSVACGIFYIGHILPGFVFPRALVWIEDQYGFRTTLLLCGALTMNATALTMLLKKPPKLKQKTNASDSSVPPTIDRDNVIESYCESAVIDDTSMNISSKRHNLVSNSLRSLRKPVFYVCVVYDVAVEYLGTSVQSTIVDYAQDKGFSLTQAESLVVYTAPFSLLGLLVIPPIADRGYMKRTTLVMSSLSLMGASLLALPACATFMSFLLVAICFQVFTSFAVMICVVVKTDYLGVEQVSTCSAVHILATVPLYICSPTIIGLFRDTMGTYDNFYRYLAALMFFASSMFLVLCICENHKKKAQTM